MTPEKEEMDIRYPSRVSCAPTVSGAIDGWTSLGRALVVEAAREWLRFPGARAKTIAQACRVSLGANADTNTPVV